jgi:hypothetical protein
MPGKTIAIGCDHLGLELKPHGKDCVWGSRHP